MPTNATPEYRKAEEAFRETRTTDEKIERLRDMISLLPKHKGTEHLHADLKRRLAQLRKEEETGGKRGGGGPEIQITHQGAAQIVLIGPANSGKSSILNALTNASVEVADYPFTTVTMLPGMVEYKGIQIQLIDTPPVTPDYIHSHLLGFLRSANAVLIVVDLASDTVLDDIGAVFTMLTERHLYFVSQPRMADRDHIPATILANKTDAPDAVTRLELLQEYVAGKLDIYPLTTKSIPAIEKQADLRTHQVKELPDMLMQWLSIIRVYTKAPDEKAPQGKPYALFKGQTVADLCVHIHKDFLEQFHSARMWRGDHPPITVSRDQALEDGDILELHI